jgi:hypothetical protein
MKSPLFLGRTRDAFWTISRSTRVRYPSGLYAWSDRAFGNRLRGGRSRFDHPAECS